MLIVGNNDLKGHDGKKTEATMKAANGKNNDEGYTRWGTQQYRLRVQAVLGKIKNQALIRCERKKQKLKD